MNKKIIIFCFSIFFLACNKEEFLFNNPSSKETGLVFENTIKPSDELNILDYLYYYNGGGVALGDINNDGSNLNDLIYVPTADEIDLMNFSGNAGQQQTQKTGLERFIAQDDYLKDSDVN